MQYTILAVYLVSLFVFGCIILKLFPLVFPKVIGWISMMLTGIIVGVPITYFLSCLFVRTGEPIRYGTLGFIGVSFLVCILCLKTKRWHANKILEPNIHYSEICLVVMAMLFSCWMMWKSVHVGTDTTWFVSRNTVFDTAHAVSLVRSFSWGNNIPFSSPFASGSVELYHFIFYFFVGLIEQLGIPLVFAFNAISAFGFAAYLIIGFYVAYVISGKNKIVGWMTTLFLIMHSTITWWYFLLVNGLGKSTIATLLGVPNYLFAGPYDGSVISLFFTLNVFVNQRHLAFAIAAGLLFFLMADALFKQKKTSYWLYIFLGGMIGSLFLWNLVIAVTGIGIVLLLGISSKKYTQVLYCFGSFLFIGITTSIPFLDAYRALFTAGTTMVADTGHKASLISVITTQGTYWISNLGLGIIACMFGWVYMKKQGKRLLIPIGILFFALVIGFAFGINEIAQKILNFWNVAFVGVCAYGIWSLWEKGKILRLLSILLFFGMTASGVIDVMVIKNDFSYPGVSQEMNQRIQTLHAILPKNAVVLSYKEMFHEVALTGRKQYYGYFAPPSMDGRWSSEKEIFESTTRAELAMRIHKMQVTHIYLPKHASSDFPYVTNLDLYRTLYDVKYEDSDFILFDVSTRMVQ